MKKSICLVLIILIMIISSIQNVFAHEMLEDGWHLVISNSDDEREKEWNKQTKVWGYYEKGVEKKRYSTIIGAHRGWGEAPENSLAAFNLAYENGYIAFETDVRFTKDNVAVLVHDDAINSLARNKDLSEIKNRILVKDLTYNQLKNNYVFPIERMNHSSNTIISGYENNKITTFEEMLDFAKSHGMYANIELKEGTRSQINSIVKMAKDKGMHNYVRWISFSTDLLQYVKDYDDDEFLGVLVSSNDCDPNQTNMYCGTDNHNYFFTKLKTSKNSVWLNPYSAEYGLPTIQVGVNLPTRINEFPKDKYTLKTIPQGKITISNTNIEMKAKNEQITYKYNGDGIVKCISSNNNIATCSIDQNHKKINITALSKSDEVEITVYATQGISYSASNDTKIKVNINDTETEVIKTKQVIEEPKVENNYTVVEVPDTNNNISIIFYIIGFISFAIAFIKIKKETKNR